MFSSSTLAKLPPFPTAGVPLDGVDPSLFVEGIAGSSKSLQRVIDLALRVAATDTTILITGETGTGKELIARLIHDRSLRGNGPFIAANCGGIPDGLFASELFGHERGSFTGANQRRIGRFELAEKGTIFLDEIGDVPLETQVTLLRVLQQREFERLGAGRTIRMNARVLAATNRDLKREVASGEFRADLYYRINVFPIHLPALRDRAEDIIALSQHFCRVYSRLFNKGISSVSCASLALLRDYHWPGNVRELQNVIERAVILCDSDMLNIQREWLNTEETDALRVIPIRRTLKANEKALIEETLRSSRGVVSGPSGAAARLGIPRSTLESRIATLRINKHQFRLPTDGEGH